ncbi:MAG: DUF6788 family protein [Candidatus Omnitrophota bacterium]
MLNESYAMLERRRKGLLKKIGRVGYFIMGTPTYLRVRCGHKGCKCQKVKGAGHEKLHLSWTDSEGNGTAYVPVGLREEVLAWVENYWLLKEYMKEMTKLSRRMIKIYVKSRKKGKKSKG